ncbi:16S rRNA (cytosine(967)-C(5))-methyltransferase [Kovacikia minuta CCNUW1]|uniref:16S rRNA (cytosine(967)-C(5))-methyltransferase n=1 Tax=Kovacikia minuta TaxID=2931930 RepID=UPI001CC9B8DE|nr:16S rRNA (cytosine(967)-C(5))-methyltransferase [Kovacikia minuta]UBF23721.1 16S rRNA (cytosine(967)-C(5))-methyltransferase [Kovacikia minuta CCNUW1]
MTQDPRQLAFFALRSIHRGAFADVAVDKILSQSDLSGSDRRLLTELVYGSVRRQRTLDALINQFAKKRAEQQPPNLRTILHLGLYQLHYLDQVPASAAVNTTVDLAKQNGFAGLAGFVNGVLRQTVRETEARGQNPGTRNQEPGTRNQEEIQNSYTPHPTPPLPTPSSSPIPHPPSLTERLGILHSFPDWMINVWLEQLGQEETERLCEWMNQTPHIDLRVNQLRSSVETVEAAMQAAGIKIRQVPHLPHALRLQEHVGSIQNLPGFQPGWWMVQDSSAQLVGYLVNPQPGEVVVDACAAPGGKTMHLAELMQDQGTVWACDRTPSRLKKLQQNADRLGLRSVKICPGDSRNLPQFIGQCDRVLVDAPCSGLGTLHRHADARWRQTPDSVKELATLQTELLKQTAEWLKPGGILVYATCTLHPTENEIVIQTFLNQHCTWQIEPPAPNSPPAAFASPEGWIKVWPHQHGMDGFFMVRLKKS